MSNSWAIWNIIKCRLAGFGDGKDLLGHLNPAFANSGLVPRVMCWTLRKNSVCQNLCQACYTLLQEKNKKKNNQRPNEQAPSHGVPGKLDCVSISLPSLGEERSPEDFHPVQLPQLKPGSPELKATEPGFALRFLQQLHREIFTEAQATWRCQVKACSF